MACNHKFQGDKDGVRCLLCGLKLTPDEYFQQSKNAPAVTVGPVDTSTVKPMSKRTRKKKEAAADE